MLGSTKRRRVSPPHASSRKCLSSNASQICGRVSLPSTEALCLPPELTSPEADWTQSVR